MTMADGGEPLWPVAWGTSGRSRRRTCANGTVNRSSGPLSTRCSSSTTRSSRTRFAEFATVRAQLLADLDELRDCCTSGHPDVRVEVRDGGRQLFAGGGLGPDWEYPNAMTGCLGQPIGSGTARTAGFQTDEDEEA